MIRNRVYFQHKYWSVMNTFVVDLQVFFDWNNVLSCFRNGVLCLYQKSFFFCLCQMEINRKLLLRLSGFLKLKFLKGFNNVINCDHLHRYALLCQISTTFNPEDIATCFCQIVVKIIQCNGFFWVFIIKKRKKVFWKLAFLRNAVRNCNWQCHSLIMT